MSIASELTPSEAAAGTGESERLLAAMGDVAERLVGRDMTDQTLPEVLAIIGGAAGVSRVRLYRILADGGAPNRTRADEEWCAPGIGPANHRPDWQFEGLDGGFSRWADAFASGRVISGIAREFPPVERAAMEMQGVLSLAVVPICTQRGVWGFIGFDDCVRERHWPDDLVRTLSIFARMLGAAFDRDDYGQRQRALEASYDALLDHLNEGVFKTDERGRFTYLNGAWRTLTGYAPSLAIGQFCGRVVGADDRHALRQALVALLRGELTRHRCEAKLLRADGSLRWVQISVRRVGLGAGEPCVLVGTIVDISANKDAEAQLRAAKQEAEAASRAKSEFLSTMSHELRTPLNAVIGLSESLLESNTDPARGRRYLELINTAGRQLFHEINAILDLARLEAGRLKLNPALMEVGSMCATLVDSMRCEVAKKQLEVEFVRPVKPTIVHADERLLSQALHNLFLNAVKFTPVGGRITLTADTDEAGIRIAITDTGIGIEPEKLHLLFKPFSQVDASLSRRFGGTGLGLVLADKFVKLHGGSIAVASKPEQGSTFTILLPTTLLATGAYSN